MTTTCSDCGSTIEIGEHTDYLRRVWCLPCGYTTYIKILQDIEENREGPFMSVQDLIREIEDDY